MLGWKPKLTITWSPIGRSTNCFRPFRVLLKRTAAALLAEIGVIMQQFPSADHLASWAGVAPGNHESAGKKKYKKRKRQSSCKSDTMRSVLGNRSLTKHCLGNEVLEDCFTTRKEKSLHCHFTAYHILKNKQIYIEGGPQAPLTQIN